MEDDPEPVMGTRAIDIHVGNRIRLRRKLLNLTQIELAARLGISPQQLQKYECGTNRVSAARLYRIAKELQVSVSFFFPGDGSGPSWMQTEAATDEMYPLRATAAREAVELMRAFAAIKDPELRMRIIALVRMVSSGNVKGGF